MNPNTPVASVPRRPGAPLDTSPKKERRTSRDPDETSVDISLADLGIPSWIDKNVRLDANSADVENAIKFPTMGSASLERL